MNLLFGGISLLIEEGKDAMQGLHKSAVLIVLEVIFES
jgi:hypothetical protein